MIRRIVRRSVRFLGSSVLATVLLIVTMVYAAVATFVPQGAPTDPSVMSWAAAHPALGTVTQLLGMHQAFGSYLFLTCVGLLAISTVLCSWQRTKAALHRSRLLRDARNAGVDQVAVGADAHIPLGNADGEDVLTQAAEGLEDLGFRTVRHGDVIRSLSSAWSVWGSPVFHWALVAFMLALMLAGSQRSDGRMGLAVGETKPHAPSSYGYLSAGGLHSWTPVDRQIRLDRFEPSFELNGLEYGPTPTVSLLDADGVVVKTQRVYPNNPLKSGSLTVHSDDYGFAVRLSILDAAGSKLAQGIQYVDFATDEPGGTRALGGVVLRNQDGSPAAQLRVTVPLDTVDGDISYWMPANPTARLLVTSPDGGVIEDRAIAVGATLGVASLGQTLRVDAIDWYYRFSVVDDATTPLLYLLMGVAFLGLTVSLIARQQALVVARVDGPEGPALAVKLRLWRNVPCEREAIIERLTAAAVPDRKVDAS